ncbi:hypothetical protein, partial [Microvirga tunisiensis]|uniref:hypothetical protein n=1 Tax=Microvirga tunisiensis TaxID=2108360 RepID=UPI001AED76F8
MRHGLWLISLGVSMFASAVQAAPYMGRYVSQVLVAGAAVISEVEPDGAHANRSSASPYIRLGLSP